MWYFRNGAGSGSDIREDCVPIGYGLIRACYLKSIFFTCSAIGGCQVVEDANRVVHKYLYKIISYAAENFSSCANILLFFRNKTEGLCLIVVYG